MNKLFTVELVEKDGVKQLNWHSQSDLLDVQLLDQLIAMLGQMRGTVEPPVKQSDPLVGEMLETIQDPRWVVGPTLDDQILLSIRHAGFGWVSFQLPPASAHALHLQLQTPDQVPPYLGQMQ